MRQDDLIVIFDECSTNFFESNEDYCYPNANKDQRLPKLPRSIPVTPGSTNDDFTISYDKEPSFDYTMTHACGIFYQGDMHFFGGYISVASRDQNLNRQADYDFSKQHFVIEKATKGTFRLQKRKDLVIGFENPSCSSFQISGFSWFRTNTIVILCFSLSESKSCITFDGELNVERPLLYKFRQ